MPRMSKKKRSEMDFFMNNKGRIEYNCLCRSCIYSCKQSHKAVVFCRKFSRREPKKRALIDCR